MSKVLIEVDIPEDTNAALFLNDIISSAVEYNYYPYRMLINDWCKEIHRWAKAQGFYDEWDSIPETHEHLFLAQRIALMHEEATEILNAIRNANWDNELEEVADSVIRLFDYAEFRGFALEQAIAAKMAINEHRPYRHGKLVF